MARVRASETTTDLTEKADHAQQRFIAACREVLLGNPYDADWLDALRIAMEQAHADMRASWVAVEN